VQILPLLSDANRAQQETLALLVLAGFAENELNLLAVTSILAERSRDCPKMGFVM
jgi:hypothetical protein